MKFFISEEARQATTKCKTGFSCLNSVKENICKVVECIDWKFHFVKCRIENDCSYQYSFGSKNYCVCPTRKEIYNKYCV